MISNAIGFLICLGLLGLGFIVLIWGVQFLAVVVFVIGAGLAGVVAWIKKQFE